MSPAENRQEIAHVRALMLSGEISQDRAKELTADRIAEMNRTGAEIAKRHGKKFRPFTFTALMR